MRRVPFLNLTAQFDEINGAFQKGLKKLHKRGDYVLGADVVHFEKNFALFSQAKFALGVNSGTDALFLSLKALGIGLGDEVIVPAYTYIASAFAVSYTGAKPVFVDIDEKTYNINLEQVERAITNRTKAIMPVHLYGQSVDMSSLLKIAKKHKLKVIEDAAQAHGVVYRNRHVGALGDLGAFSFYPTKNLGACGDGGMIVTNSKVLYEKLWRLRDYGRKSKYLHVSFGYNSRLDGVQALILEQKLRHINRWNKNRIRMAQLYLELLSDSAGIGLPQKEEYSNHIYNCFVIRVKKRDKIVNGLRHNGIGVMVHYPYPLHLQPVYKNLGYLRGDFPISERVSKEVISLPIYSHLNEKDVRYVVTTLKRLVSNG